MTLRRAHATEDFSRLHMTNLQFVFNQLPIQQPNIAKEK